MATRRRTSRGKWHKLLSPTLTTSKVEKCTAITANSATSFFTNHTRAVLKPIFLEGGDGYLRSSRPTESSWLHVLGKMS